MKRITLRRRGRAARLGAIFLFGGTLGALSQTNSASGERLLEHPFTAQASITKSPSAVKPNDTAEDADAPATPPIGEAEGPSDGHFSLWDFFSSLFELGSPGDPNHPDKLRLIISPTLGYDDNVFTTQTDRIASGTAGLGGVLAYNFGAERLKFATSLSLGTTNYDNRPGDATDYNGILSAQVSYFASRRLQISANIGLSYLSQPNPTLIGGVSRFSGDYMVANGGISVAYAIRPRLSMRAEFRTSTIKYAEEDQNQSLGFSDQSYVLGLDYLFSPRVTLTTEYRYNPLSYYESDQDSTGQILTGGFTAAFSPRLKWVLQGGAEMRMLNNTTQPDARSQYIGPFLETDMQYDFTPSSSLIGTIRYGTEPSGVAGISVRETLRGSLALHYAFGGRLSADLALSYEHDNYDQPGDANDSAQDYYTGSMGLRYQFNPALALSARYDYSTVKTGQEVSDYTRGVSTLGLEIIF